MTDAASPDPAEDIRPVVARKPSKAGLWAFGIVMAVVAGTLFATLEMRRSSISSPTVLTPVEPSRGTIASPPPLAIPPDFHARRLERPRTMRRSVEPVASPAAARPAPPTAAPAPVRAPPEAESEPEPSARPEPDPAYVYRARPEPASSANKTTDEDEEEERAHASHLKNPATTVPQGTVMQAVLETALDSNHPGYARAVISRDIYSFDGSRVLVPKGSKLFGEYAGEVRLGQNRALIRWHRLTRPDGAIINVDSPSADPLGRAGVKGKVDTHFFGRFGGAILQSILNVGVQLATRKATGDTVIVGMPGSTQQIPAIGPQEVQPTLKVKQGTGVSVFVMRDLDFTDVEL